MALLLVSEVSSCQIFDILDCRKYFLQPYNHASATASGFKNFNAAVSLGTVLYQRTSPRVVVTSQNQER